MRQSLAIVTRRVLKVCPELSKGKIFIVNDKVVRTRKSYIFKVFDEMQLGELLTHYPETIGGKKVIDDPALYLPGWGIFHHGGKAVFQPTMMTEFMLDISDMIHLNLAVINL